jgi:hypothetical protein
MLPCCVVAAVKAACEAMATCKQSADDGGADGRACDALDARATSKVESVAHPAQGVCSQTVTNIYKPDGSLCYSVEYLVDSGTACESAYVFWRDGAGQNLPDAATRSFYACVGAGASSDNCP